MISSQVRAIASGRNAWRILLNTLYIMYYDRCLKKYVIHSV